MKKFSKILILIFLIASCSLKKDVDINLPAHQSQIFVESYLVPGNLFGVSLTETVSYLDSFYYPKIHNATVVIKYKDEVDTLFETTAGLYTSDNTVPADYKSDFFLYVKDVKGRVVTGKTKIQPPVKIDSINFAFNNKNKAATIVYFNDDENISNYYRIFLLYLDHGLFKDDEFNGKMKPYISNYNMKENDTIDVKLLNISKDCFEFIQSVQNSAASNIRPLTEPGPIKSNVTGGIGVFTGLSYTQHKIIVKK